MIAGFLRGLESVFTWLLETSWQASVLVALVLLLQVALRGRLNPRWHHALWLLVVLRLVLPVLPESALSLFQFTPQHPPAITHTVTEPIFVTAPAEPVSTVHLDTPAPAYPISLYTLLSLTWLAGACEFLLITWMVNHRFGRHVRNAPAIDDPRLLEIAAAAQAELGLHRSLRMIESAQVNSPAMMGLFQPTLLLPADVRSRFNDEELRFIFLHEFAHLKRGDLVVQGLIALLQILHWFNPVLWYAFRRMRIDREPATDALVLSRTGEAEKDRYGHVLIKLLEHYHQRHSLPTLVGILEDKDQFKRRFLLISKFTSGAYGWSMLGVLLIAVLGAICLTGARAQDTAAKAEKYLEVTFVETPGAMNGVRGSGPRSPEEMLKMLRDPDSKVSVLADVVLKDGPISLNGKTPATFDYRITGDWKTSLTEPQKIDIRINDPSSLRSGWQTKESLSQGQPVVVFQAWKSASHANLLIRIVDHPGSVNSATDPKTLLTDGTLVELALALKENAKAISSDHQRLQILQAFYGADGSWQDVSVILQKSVKNNYLKVSWQQPYTEIGGDPAYLQVKTLIISYRLDGVEKMATFREQNFPVGLQAAIPTEDEGKSSNPAPTPVNSATDDAHGSQMQVSTTPKPVNPSVKFSLTMAEIDEKDYQQNAHAMDDAVQRGDASYFAGRITRMATIWLKTGQPGWYSEGTVQSYIDASATKVEKTDGKPHIVLQAKSIFFGLNADLSWSPDKKMVNSTWQVTIPTGYEKQALPAGIQASDIPGGFLLAPQVHVARYEDKNWDMAPGKGHGFWVGDTLSFVKLIGKQTEQGGDWDKMIKSETPSCLAVFLTAQPATASDRATSIQTPDLNAQMLTAVRKGDATALQKLIEQSADPLAKDEQDNDLLDYLFSYSPRDQAFPLNALAAALKRSDDPNPQIHTSGTPSESYPLLDQAIVDVGLPQPPEVVPSYRAAVKMLLDHGASFNQVSDHNVQALLKAALLGYLTTIQRSIQLGASINSADGNGYNALTISVAMHNDDCANWLIDHGADVAGYARSGVYSPLRFAIWRNQPDLSEKIIKRGARANFPGAGLPEAVNQNDQRLFDDLIKAGASPKNDLSVLESSGGLTWRLPESIPLFVCIKKGQSAMAITLLEHGADPEPTYPENNRNLAYWAVSYDRPEILQALLDHGANPLLKDNGGNPFAKDTSHGESALSLAQKSHPDLVPMLEKAVKGAGTTPTDTTVLPNSTKPTASLAP